MEKAGVRDLNAFIDLLEVDCTLAERIAFFSENSESEYSSYDKPEAGPEYSL